jgi:multiple sugar transport system ATP-binding protein
MGDRVAVLCDGVLQQCATPRELYRNPANIFVAGFIGSPAMNLFTLPVHDGSVALGGWEIRAPREISGSHVVVGIRPEHLEVSSLGLEIEVDVVEELGADAYVYGRIVDGATPVVSRTDALNPPQRGSRLRLQPAPSHTHFFGTDGLPIC